MLRDLANKKKLDAIHLTETHDQNPVALGPLKEWHSMPSVPIEGRHGTAILTAMAPEGVKTDSNITASCIKWEGQHIWLISAYFPNSLEGTKATIKGLRAMLNTLKTKQVILAGDFNSTETLSSFDTGGLLLPSIAKDRNAESHPRIP
jgi:exonuclease III